MQLHLICTCPFNLIFKLHLLDIRFSNDEETDSQLETPIDNFGVSFIFERALRRLDVHAEQRKLQQNKFDSRLNQFENDNQILENRLTNKGKDFEKLQDKYITLQVSKSITKSKTIIDKK